MEALPLESHDVPLDGIARLNDTRLAGFVPAGLAVGLHDVVVRNPGAPAEGRLTEAFTVFSPADGDDFFAGRLEAARNAQVRFAPLVRALFCETNPLPVKHALVRMGKIGPELRLPLVPVSEKGAAQVEAALAAYGLT